MGLSIYYSGRLKNAKLLPALIEEVKDVAQVYGWKYHTYNTHFQNDEFGDPTSFDKIYGINFTPTNCETVSIAFLSNGTIVCPARVQFFAHSKDEEERSWIYTVSVKTQYAGIIAHQFLIHFFKYLNDRYFCDFKLADESEYWETDDEEKMKEQFAKYDSLIDNLVLAMETFPVEKGENMTAYFERLMRYINELKKK
ncbi:MAG: hypothetical protein LBR48_00940 [Dysgonamonadaceae bacterium]|jgi:hypothetical protein|nr:hypothetical protein [Dysgonamonadaceae bacterium]